MKTEPKKIFAIDDQGSVLAESQYGRIFPNSEIKGFSNSAKVIEALREIQDGNYPDLLLLDAAFEGVNPFWGANNAISTLTWLQENAPTHPLPHIIFQSAEIEKARRALQYTKREIENFGSEAIAIDKDDVGLVVDILKPEGTPKMRHFENAHLPKFLNRMYGFELPVTEVEFNNLLKARTEIDPREVVRLVDNDMMARDEALERLAAKSFSSLDAAYRSTLVHERDEHEFNLAHSLSFKHGTGQPVTGPAAFSAEDAIAQYEAGKKPVLIMKSVGPDIVQLFKYVAAIVVFSNNGGGHLEQLAQAHQIPALLGREPQSRTDKDKTVVVLRNTASMPYLDFYANIRSSHNNIQTAIRRGAEELKLVGSGNGRRSAETSEDEEQTTTQNFYRVKISVKSGAEVTVDPDRWRLYSTGLRIEEATHSDYYSWLDRVNVWLNEWEIANGIKHLKFKKNVDITDQIQGRWGDEGVGLVRTEHFTISSPETLEAFRNIVLKENISALEEFERLQQDDFRSVLSLLCESESAPVRIRLIDAPPPEFFSDTQLNKFEALYGNKNVRGVQLALHVPQLYEAQIRAIFGAYIALQERAKEQDWYKPPSGPVEIMVPTTRTGEELVFVKNMVARIAGELNFDQNNYRFGSMLETLDACENIREIAPLCEFISIGSNDLTAEVLDCRRDDWDKRHKLTIDSRTNSDPFITLDKRVLSRIEQTVNEARILHPGLQVDICGAHAADLPSLIALRSLKLDGASMPPSTLNQQALAIRYKYDAFHLYSTNPVEAARIIPKPTQPETAP